MLDVIVQQLQQFIGEAANNKAFLTEEQINEAVEAYKETLQKHFTKQEEKGFTLRMSSVGRSYCQQWMEKNHEPEEDLGYATKMKFVIGDIVESLVFVCMKGAGIELEGTQQEVTLDIGGISLKGHYDVKIAGAIYDVKTASPYAYDKKFTDFKTLREDDPFGYVAQGYAYAEADKSELGGWIVINKATGEIKGVPTPIADNSYRKEALKNIEELIRKVEADAPFERGFTGIPETYYGKATGNTKLPFTCQYCAFKKRCWGDKLTLAANPRSKAAFTQKTWYIGEVK